MSVIGYARVSTNDQTLDTQLEALSRSGCDRIFSEKASGRRADRPELAAALSYLRPDDTFVVWRLDRLGRNLRHLIDVVQGLRDAGVEFRSINEGFDTSTPGGRLIFHVFGAFAEFERDLTEERTRETIATKRARGAQIGRRTAVTPDRLAEAQRMLDSGEHSVTSVARVLGIGRSTLYRALAEQ